MILRSRLARRYRMLADEVSGRKMVNRARVNPDSHISSQIGHFHPLACAAKPPTSGPSTGPQIALMPQIPMEYALLAGLNMSARVAPPYHQLTNAMA